MNFSTHPILIPIMMLIILALGHSIDTYFAADDLTTFLVAFLTALIYGLDLRVAYGELGDHRSPLTDLLLLASAAFLEIFFGLVYYIIRFHNITLPFVFGPSSVEIALSIRRKQSTFTAVSKKMIYKHSEMRILFFAFFSWCVVFFTF